MNKEILENLTMVQRIIIRRMAKSYPNPKIRSEILHNLVGGKMSLYCSFFKLIGLGLVENVETDKYVLNKEVYCTIANVIPIKNQIEITKTELEIIKYGLKEKGVTKKDTLQHFCKRKKYLSAFQKLIDKNILKPYTEYINDKRVEKYYFNKYLLKRNQII